MSAEQRAAAGIGQLPESLKEAIDELEKSDLLREALGEPVFRWLIRNKRIEWHQYRTRVTQWEIEEYLPLL